jgi:hypothetical protein
LVEGRLDYFETDATCSGGVMTAPTRFGSVLCLWRCRRLFLELLLVLLVLEGSVLGVRHLR